MLHEVLRYIHGESHCGRWANTHVSLKLVQLICTNPENLAINCVPIFGPRCQYISQLHTAGGQASPCRAWPQAPPPQKTNWATIGGSSCCLKPSLFATVVSPSTQHVQGVDNSCEACDEVVSNTLVLLSPRQNQAFGAFAAGFSVTERPCRSRVSWVVRVMWAGHSSDGGTKKVLQGAEQRDWQADNGSGHAPCYPTSCKHASCCPSSRCHILCTSPMPPQWTQFMFLELLVSAPACDIPSGCCSFTGPWAVTRSSLRMLRRVAAFCRPLRPVLLLVSFPHSRSPVVGVLGLC